MRWHDPRSELGRDPGQLVLKCREWLSQQSFSHHITLTPNDQFCHPERLKRELWRWSDRMNRDVVGRQWRDRDAQNFWAAFPEKLETNPHWHVLFRAARPVDLLDFEAGAKAIWRRLVRDGTAECSPITCIEGIAKYVTKELGKPSRYELFQLSSGRH